MKLSAFNISNSKTLGSNNWFGALVCQRSTQPLNRGFHKESHLCDAHANNTLAGNTQDGGKCWEVGYLFAYPWFQQQQPAGPSRPVSSPPQQADMPWSLHVLEKDLHAFVDSYLQGSQLIAQIIWYIQILCVYIYIQYINISTHTLFRSAECLSIDCQTGLVLTA